MKKFDLLLLGILIGTTGFNLFAGATDSTTVLPEKWSYLRRILPKGLFTLTQNKHPDSDPWTTIVISELTNNRRIY